MITWFIPPIVVPVMCAVMVGLVALYRLNG
jgi:hypothetical protein